MPELDRYIQCYVLLETSASYGGMGELWCKDVAAFERCWSSPELVEEQLPGTLNFVEPDPIDMIAEEIRVLWPSTATLCLLGQPHRL